MFGNSQFGTAQFGTSGAEGVSSSYGYGQAQAFIGTYRVSGQAGAFISRYENLILLSSPVAYWPLQESAGTVAYDAAGWKNGTYTGGATLLLGQSGPFSNTKSVYFPAGDTTYIEFSTPPTGLPSSNGSRSYELWFKTTQTTQAAIIGYGQASNGSQFVLILNYAGNDLEMSHYNVDGGINISNEESDGNWHHLVVTYDGTYDSFWLDGVYRGQANVGTLTTVLSNGPDIGKLYYASGFSFNGNMAHVAIYGKVLNEAEIVAHFTGTPLGFGQALASITVPFIVVEQVAQAQAAIKQTYIEYAQAAAEIVSPWTRVEAFAQALTDVLQTYTVFAQAQANIKATAVTHGQAQAIIAVSYLTSGQAQAKIRYNVALVYPGTSWIEHGQNTNKLSTFFHVTSGQTVIVRVVNPPSDGGNIGIQRIGSNNGPDSTNQWFNSPSSNTTYTFTGLGTGEFALYSWNSGTYRAGLTGSGTIHVIDNFIYPQWAQAQANIYGIIVQQGAQAQASIYVPPYPTEYMARVFQDSPIAYYRLGEASGSTFANEVNPSEPLSLVAGTPIYNTSHDLGDGDGAINFNNSAKLSGTIAALTTLGSTTTGHFTTTEFWVKWNGSDQGMPFSWNISYSDIYFNTATSFGINTGAGDVWGFDPTAAGMANKWVHLVVVWCDNTANSTGDLKIYLNGVAQSLSGSGGSTPDVGTGIILSGWTAGGQAIAAQMDELAIYDGELSAATILDHYNAGLPKGFGNAQALIVAGKKVGQALATIDTPGFKTGYAMAKTLGWVAQIANAQAKIIWKQSRNAQAQAEIVYKRWAHAQARPHIKRTERAYAIAHTTIDTQGLKSGNVNALIVGPYEALVVTDGAQQYLKLEDTGVTNVAQAIVGPNGTYPTSWNSYYTFGQQGILGKSILAVNGRGITTTYGEFTDTFTIEAWVKPTSSISLYSEATSGAPGTSGQQWVYYPNQKGSNRGVGLSVGTNGIQVFHHGDGNLYTPLSYTVTVPSTSWTHVVVVYNSGIPSLYVDGTYVKDGLSTTGTKYSPTLFAGSTTYNFWDGYTDEMAIYNVALNATQIASHYLALSHQQYGQAQALIIKLVFGQAHVYVFQDKVWGLAQALYKQHFSLAQANAHIIAFDVPRFAQANAIIVIKQITYAQALTAISIANIRAFGLARPRIKVENNTGFAQADTLIDLPLRYAQALADILIKDIPVSGNAGATLAERSYPIGNAMVHVKAINKSKFAQANALILWYKQFGQAVAYLTANNVIIAGTAQALIYNIYIFKDTFTRTTSYNEPVGTPDIGPAYTLNTDPTWPSRYLETALNGSQLYVFNDATGGYAWTDLFNYIVIENGIWSVDFKYGTTVPYGASIALYGRVSSGNYVTGNVWIDEDGYSVRVENYIGTYAFDFLKWPFEYITPDVWYTLKFYLVDDMAKAKLWKRDLEPEPDWQASLTVPTNPNNAVIEVYADNGDPHGSNPVFLDNYSVTIEPFKYYCGFAQALIGSESKVTFGNAAASISGQSWVFGQAATHLRSEWTWLLYGNPYGQAKARITGKLANGTYLQDGFNREEDNTWGTPDVWGPTWQYDPNTGNGDARVGVPVTSPAGLIPESAGQLYYGGSGSDFLRAYSPIDAQDFEAVIDFRVGTQFTMTPSQIDYQYNIGFLGRAYNENYYFFPGIMYQHDRTLEDYGYWKVFEWPEGGGLPGTSTSQQVYYPIHRHTWYRVKLRLAGDSLHFKIWRRDSDPEPLAWFGDFYSWKNNNNSANHFIVHLYNGVNETSENILIDRINVSEAKITASGQTQALITNKMGHGIAAAYIGRYFRYAQAEANIYTPITFRFGQALALIQKIQTGQATTWIISTNTQNYGIALASIWKHNWIEGQSQAYIKKTQQVSGQAAAFINLWARPAQAQAKIKAFKVPNTGLAAAYVKGGEYLVMYAGQKLPGYAQYEQDDSVMAIVVNQATYMDASLDEYIGLQNKNLEIAMRIWEKDYLTCKAEFQRGVTILRSNQKTFEKLYLQSPDKYYLVMPKSVRMEKSASSSPKILDYEVSFNAKPWLLSNEVHSISGTGTINTDSVSRTYANGGWSPATLRISGTNVTVSGYTATGDFTGFISVSGAVTNLTIDSENYTATMNGVNANKYMKNLDYQVYVGPSKTYFAITGASACTVEWQDRWYL